jgi:hypothetical protein
MTSAETNAAKLDAHEKRLDKLEAAVDQIKMIGWIVVGAVLTQVVLAAMKA